MLSRADGRGGGVAAPPRAPFVIGAIASQLIGAVALVLGLASLPVAHDLHRPLLAIGAWIGAAVGALVAGALAYRVRPLALAFAAALDAGFGVAMPRTDGALGSLMQLVPPDDFETAQTIATACAIIAFCAASLCAVGIPLAVRFRRWEVAAAAESSTMEPFTTVVHGSRSRPWLIALVAVAVVAAGSAVWFARDGKDRRDAPAAATTSADAGAPNVAAVAVADAGVGGGVVARDAAARPAPAAAPAITSGASSPQAVVSALHDAIGRGDRTAISALMAPTIAWIGADADAVVDGSAPGDARARALAILDHDLAPWPTGTVQARATSLATAGDTAWLGEVLVTPGGAAFTITAALHADRGTWTIAALEWAVAVANDQAFKLARAHALAAPVAIHASAQADAPDDLVAAARTAFASAEQFAAARSTRADALNFGSAPGERIIGGEAGQRAFAHLDADIGIRDGIRAVALDRASAYTIVNVDFTAADRDGAQVSQTMRVLAVWLREGATWRIVQSQFANPRPR